MSNFLIDTLNVFEGSGAENLVCLQKTAKLSGKDDEEWLAEAYRVSQKKSAVGRYMVSFCNSVVFQRRLVFILNKRLFGVMMRSDENHTRKNRGFDNSKWKEFFFKLCQSGFIEVVEVGKNGEQICRLMHKELIQKIAILTAMDTMTALYDSQMKQAIDFIENKVPPALAPAHPSQPTITSPRNKELEKRQPETSLAASLFTSEKFKKPYELNGEISKSPTHEDLSEGERARLLESLTVNKAVSERVQKEKLAKEEKIKLWETKGSFPKK